MEWGLFSAGVIRRLIWLHDMMNANVHQNFSSNTWFLSCKHHSMNQPFSYKTLPTAKRMKQILKFENIKLMKWPAQNPDVNPIKTL